MDDINASENTMLTLQKLSGVLSLTILCCHHRRDRHLLNRGPGRSTDSLCSDSKTEPKSTSTLNSLHVGGYFSKVELTVYYEA